MLRLDEKFIRILENKKQLGFISVLLATIFAFLTFGIALLTPPISGPFAEDPISYPFAEIASRFPRDYIWMYFAMVWLLFFMMMYVFLYEEASEKQKMSAHIGLLLAQLSAGLLFADYFIQVSIVQISLLKGETEGMALLTQYNPHGLFVVVEEIGYLFMCISFLFIMPVFSKDSMLDRAVRNIFLWAFLLGVLALIVISVGFGIYREYIFEVVIISIDFLALILAGCLLCIRYKNKKQQ